MQVILQNQKPYPNLNIKIKNKEFRIGPGSVKNQVHLAELVE